MQYAGGKTCKLRLGSITLGLKEIYRIPRCCRMKTAIKVLLFPLLAVVLLAQRPWQQITVPSVRDVAANFKAPPHEYGAIQPFTSWNGPDAKDRMARVVQDLDRLSANGVFVVNVSPGRGEPMYLTPE